jgi:hypothetical protein
MRQNHKQCCQSLLQPHHTSHARRITCTMPNAYTHSRQPYTAPAYYDTAREPQHRAMLLLTQVREYIEQWPAPCSDQRYCPAPGTHCCLQQQSVQRTSSDRAAWTLDNTAACGWGTDGCISKASAVLGRHGGIGGRPRRCCWPFGTPKTRPAVHLMLWKSRCKMHTRTQTVMPGPQRILRTRQKQHASTAGGGRQRSGLAGKCSTASACTHPTQPTTSATPTAR